MQDEDFIGAYTGPRTHFHWPAALIPLWLAYHGLWLPQLMVLLLEVVTLGAIMGWLDTDNLLAGLPLAALIWIAIKGALAPILRRYRAGAHLGRLRRKGISDEEAMAAMRRAGAGSWTGVVVTVVVVAAATWWLDRLAREKANHIHVVSMRSSLRDLAVAQDNFYADHGRYNPGPIDTTSGRYGVRAGSGVQITLGPVTESGWSATATHASAQRMCAIYVGTAEPPISGAMAGEPRCTDHGRR